MTQMAFGTGQMWARPVGSGKTPVEFGSLQGVVLNFEFDTIPHYGRSVFPIHMSRGNARIAGTATFAAINARLFSDILFGGLQNGPVVGATRTVVQEPGTVTGGNVTVSQASTFIRDLGVVRATNGDIYEKVLSGPLTRQYACNETSGVYSFGIDSENRPMLFSYNYADASNGKQVYLTNHNQCAAPTFSLVLHEIFNGKNLTVCLNACVSEKLTLQNKLQDFTLPSFSFRCQADANGVIGTLSFDEDATAWICSAIYPLSATDTFNCSATFTRGRLGVPPMDTFNASATFTGATLGNGLRNYSNGVPDTFNGTVGFVAGNLVSGLRFYGNGIPETFNASNPAWVGANLVRGLQNYSNGLPESFNCSNVVFTGGTLA